MRILFLDYDGVVNTLMWYRDKETSKYKARYHGPKDGRVNNYQAVQWVSELCWKYSLDIIVTSTWRGSDNYKECLRNGGLRSGIPIRGCVCLNHSLNRAGQINQYLQMHPDVGNHFLILDDEVVDMKPFGYDDEHLVRCTTNGGFQYEEFHTACNLLDNLLNVSKDTIY